MDRTPKPLAEISKVNPSLSMSIFDTKQLLEIFILKRLRTKIVQKVFNGYSPIEVFIERQKRLSNRLVILAQLRLNLQVQLSDPFRQLQSLALPVLLVLSAHFFDVAVLVALVLFVENVQLREENLAKLIK